MKKESLIQDEIRLALGSLKGVVFERNNCGVAKHFDEKTHAVQMVRYGLGVGSADLVGVVDGRFVALEVKRPGESPTKEQILWANKMRCNGAFVAVVTSADEALAAIKRCREGRSE
jgi:hypothetical protein